MGFQVIRVEKLKSAARLAGRLRHALRDKVPGNADPERQDKNYYCVPGMTPVQTAKLPPGDRTPVALAAWRAKLPPKFRKDAVQAIEVLVTMSKADAARVLAQGAKKQFYLYDSIKFLERRFGGPENVIGWAIHNDETTPHLSLFIIPKVGDRLCAKHYIDGPTALSKFQTDFHREVATKYDLERGREKSPARHTSIKEFYALGAEGMRQKQLDMEAKRLARKNKKELER